MQNSVICPVFNTHAHLLMAAVQSVLSEASDYLAELQPVDDYSTNSGTLAMLDELSESGPRESLNKSWTARPSP